MILSPPLYSLYILYELEFIRTPIGRPIISRNDGHTERISAFVDSLLQPIAKSQNSYLNRLYKLL